MSGAPPWTILGPLLAPFYGVFGLTFEVFWRFFGDVSESWFEVVFFENFLGGAAEDHLKCKKRSGIHSDRALLLNALPVPLLRQVPFSCFFGIVFWFVFGKRFRRENTYSGGLGSMRLKRSGNRFIYRSMCFGRLGA